jgi:hypothetical protein
MRSDENRKTADMRMMKCIVLVGITAGIAVTEVKRVAIAVNRFAKKVKVKFKKNMRNKHVD